MKTRWAVLALFAAVTIQAQLTESIEVRITNVDVVVTDRAGKPVKGLTKDDFEVFEGGEPQPVTNFYEIRDNTETLPEEETGEVVPAVAAPAPPEVSQRRIVVVFDNMSIHPFARAKAIASLEKALDSLMRPGDEAMVAFWDHRMKVVVPFTADRGDLIAQLRAETKKHGAAQMIYARRLQIIEQASQAVMDARSGQRRKSLAKAYEEAMFLVKAHAEEMRSMHLNLIEDLKRTTTMLAGLEGKKTMIYLGAELSENPAVELFYQVQGLFGPDISAAPAEFTESGRNIGREMRTIATEANSNNVTIYMVDTADHDAMGDPTTHMPAPLAKGASETATPLTMNMIASLTGGLLVRGGEGFDAALKTIASDLSSYYSLGYRSPEGKGNRRIVVKVKRDGLRVRSRSSYVAKDGDEDVQDRVVANLFNEGVKSDFPVTVETGVPEKESNGRYRIPVTVTLPSSLTLIPQDDSLTGEFTVFIATGEEEGAMSSVSKAVQPMKFPGDSREAIEEQGTFTYTTTLVVRKGQQIVSVGVTDTLAGTTGFARTKVVAQ
ncbi:MAG TPA: VWA domain-containing protein [Thermoanaerobaculia bacterium]|nr:VWA domain-containing protein [Thermoanaerobaculia bacterium]